MSVWWTPGALCEVFAGLFRQHRLVPSVRNTGLAPVESIGTGLLSLDLALGGGYPRGRIAAIVGPESSGKTSLALLAVASVQRRGGLAAIIDVDQSLDLGYARATGVQASSLVLSAPRSGEQALAIAAILAGSGGIDLLVVDSVTGLAPRSELEAPLGASPPPPTFGRAFSSLAGSARRGGTTVLVLDQRQRVARHDHMSDDHAATRAALDVYASVRLALDLDGPVRRGFGVPTQRVATHVLESRRRGAARRVAVDLVHGRGFDADSDRLDDAREPVTERDRRCWPGDAP